jgi:hypothetical protein
MNDGLIHPVWPTNLLLARARLRLFVSADHVLIAKLPKDRLGQEGRIIVPHSAGRIRSMRTTWGQVMAIGEDVKEVKVGIYVHWDEYAGMDPRRTTHYDIDAKGRFLALPGVLPQDRRFVILREAELDASVEVAEGEYLPSLRDAD